MIASNLLSFCFKWILCLSVVSFLYFLRILKMFLKIDDNLGMIPYIICSSIQKFFQIAIKLTELCLNLKIALLFIKNILQVLIAKCNTASWYNLFFNGKVYCPVIWLCGLKIKNLAFFQTHWRSHSAIEKAISWQFWRPRARLHGCNRNLLKIFLKSY